MELIHFTRSARAVGQILQEGFVFSPNRKLLAEAVFSDPEISADERGRFGSISFRECGESQITEEHCREFGSFGICVSEEWARSNRAHPVTYLDRTGPIALALRTLFAAALERLRADRGGPGGGDRLRKPEYASVLTLYEYLEPIEHSYQREWRIVNGIPVGELTRAAKISPEESRRLARSEDFRQAAPVRPEDIRHLLCFSDQVQELRECLPPDFRSHEIREIVPSLAAENLTAR